MDSDIFEAIRAKYGFDLPPEYRRMERDGFFDLANDATYLWIPEAEWMTPGEILAHEPEPYHKPGFVPFAFTGAGDHWCWWPAQDPEMVVLCPHDDGIGRLDAPNLLASVYRRCLEYAVDRDWWTDEAEARGWLSRWAESLGDYLPERSVETLKSLAEAQVVEWLQGSRSHQGLLTMGDLNYTLARDHAFPRLDEEFVWMHDF